MKPIIDELEERISLHKNRHNLSVSPSGTLSVSKTGIPVVQNTFEGEEND